MKNEKGKIKNPYGGYGQEYHIYASRHLTEQECGEEIDKYNEDKDNHLTLPNGVIEIYSPL